jgi:hypothetical protein
MTTYRVVCAVPAIIAGSLYRRMRIRQAMQLMENRGARLTLPHVRSNRKSRHKVLGKVGIENFA